MVDSGIALYVHKVMLGGQFAVKICCLDADVGIICKALGSALYDGKHLGTSLVQGLFQYLQHFLLQLVYLLEEGGTVLNLCLWNTFLDFRYLLAQRHCLFRNGLTDFLNTGTQIVVAERLNSWIYVQHSLHKRTIGLEVARLLVAEEFN